MNLEMLRKAIEIAVKAHSEQKDKNGNPYIFHLISVMNKGKTVNEKIVGILHDIIEDQGWTTSKLREEGFDDEIVEAIRCLTKLSEDEPYDEALKRVSSNDLAHRVKVYDLEDNLDVKRLSVITERDLKRLNKYLRAYQFLTEQLVVA